MAAGIIDQAQVPGRIFAVPGIAAVLVHLLQCIVEFYESVVSLIRAPVLQHRGRVEIHFPQMGPHRLLDGDEFLVEPQLQPPESSKLAFFRHLLRYIGDTDKLQRSGHGGDPGNGGEQAGRVKGSPISQKATEARNACQQRRKAFEEFDYAAAACLIPGCASETASPGIEDSLSLDLVDKRPGLIERHFPVPRIFREQPQPTGHANLLGGVLQPIHKRAQRQLRLQPAGLELTERRPHFAQDIVDHVEKDRAVCGIGSKQRSAGGPARRGGENLRANIFQILEVILCGARTVRGGGG